MPFVPFEQLPAHSRIWIYQSDRALNDSEQAKVLQQTEQFVQQWSSHQKELQASGAFLHRHFLILSVDEQSAGASGCAIDKSVAFVQRLGQELGVDFFNRLNFAYQDGEQVEVVSKDEFAARYAQGQLQAQSIVFNNLIQRKEQLEKGWKLALAESWHARFV